MLEYWRSHNQFHLGLSPHSADGNKRRSLGDVDYADYRSIHFPHILEQNPASYDLFYKIAISGSAVAGSHFEESKNSGMIGKPVQAQYIIHNT